MVSDRERIGVLHGQLKSTVQARVDEVVQAGWSKADTAGDQLDCTGLRRPRLGVRASGHLAR